MRIKNIILSLLVVIILAAVGWAYWYFLMGPVTVPLATPEPEPTTPYQPLGRPGPGGSATTGSRSPTSTTTVPQAVTKPLPTLRLLSDTPVSGFGASTTASTTKVLWVERGRGKVFEARYDSNEISTLSNTIVPKIFTLTWNKNLTAFVGSLFEDGSLTPSTVYAELNRQTRATSSSSLAPYELKGRNISGNVMAYAASPDKTQLFMLMNENGTGVGYVSSFSGQNPTRIFTTPLTELNAAWPADGIIAITTKGSASHAGFLYFVNPKTGVWTKILGPVTGLSAIVNHTGKYVFYSATGKNSDTITSIYNIQEKTAAEGLIKTLADKCAWGNFYRELVYCGVPSQLPAAIYPDDWYLGTVSTADKVWQVNAVTGEASQVASLADQSDRLIGIYRPELDSRDKYLFFINKNDLSLWSLDLVKSR